MMLLKLGAHPIEYTKIKNMRDHRLPKQAWNIRRYVQKLQKPIRTKSSHLVGCITKWFKRWGIKR